MNCKECSSKDVEYFKSKHSNDTYHYLLACNNCFTRYNIERNAENFDLVKDSPWLNGESLKENRRRYKKLRKHYLITLFDSSI